MCSGAALDVLGHERMPSLRVTPQGKKRLPVVFVVGPTASGKSAVALRLADRRTCGLISADAMQIYKGMDIVTDKPDKVTRRRHPCALIDTVAPRRAHNVAEFCRAARRAIREALRKGRCPVVVGGTGLYIRALIEGIFKGPSADARVRARLERQAREKGKAFLYEHLRRVDHTSADRIGPHNLRRIIRAMEVHRLTGRPLSEMQKSERGLKDSHDLLIFGLRRSREDLYARIDRRVDQMMERGLVGEIKRLLGEGLGVTAYCCIGIREVEGYLQGRYDLEEAVRLIKRNTRHFAKRQLTWWRKNKDIAWIDVATEEDLAVAAGQIASEIKGVTARAESRSAGGVR